MLVLTRKAEESIMISDEIEIKVVSIEGNQIRLGIDAPQDIEVHRKEIYEEIEAENKEAADVQRQNLKDIAKLVEKKEKKRGLDEL